MASVAEPPVSAKTKGRILIVDDELVVRDSLGKWFSSEGYTAKPVAGAREALETIQQQEFDLALLDIKMPGMDGMELQARLREADPDLTVIIMTGYASVDTAVQALKRGAYDYITKPVDPDELSHLIERALEHKRAHREVARLRENLQEVAPGTELIGRSPAMRKVTELIEMVAPTDATVLITGESGTGKELVARAIHHLSPRRDGPFVAINCAALPETLMESELFGHEKGAFTGAVERRAGCFELAQNGTLLLDELAEMPVGTQAKLLRVLEDSRVRRLGSKGEVDVDVRVVASTNKVLEEALRKGELREDLYYRLNVFEIHLPPLRQREGDLPALAAALIEVLNRKHETRVVDMHPDVMEQFKRHSWPGNVRELRNVLERAVILAGEGSISVHHLPRDFGVPAGSRPQPQETEPDAVRLPVGTTVGEAEKALIQLTLQYTKNNKTRAAEILGISLKTLFNKLKEYGAAEAEAGTSA